jgi:hypothetical protein
MAGTVQTCNKDHTMTLRLTAPFVLVAALVSACGGIDRNPYNDPRPVCEEQSEMARAGKVGGGDITITCP